MERIGFAKNLRGGGGVARNVFPFCLNENAMDINVALTGTVINLPEFHFDHTPEVLVVCF